MIVHCQPSHSPRQRQDRRGTADDNLSVSEENRSSAVLVRPRSGGIGVVQLACLLYCTSVLVAHGFRGRGRYDMQQLYTVVGLQKERSWRRRRRWPESGHSLDPAALLSSTTGVHCSHARPALLSAFLSNASNVRCLRLWVVKRLKKPYALRHTARLGLFWPLM